MAIAGLNSQVYAKSSSAAVVATDKVDGIIDVTLGLPVELLETTNFKTNGGYKTRVLGLQDSSVDISGQFVAGDAPQQLLRSSKTSGAVVYITVIGDPTASAGSQGFDIPMLVQEFTIKATSGGLAEFTCKLVGNGAPVAV